jgi:uncharacterized protein (DUF305 family)
MKKIVILAAVVLALASGAAYAHMHQAQGDEPSMHQQHGGTMGPSMMHGRMMHGGMTHGGMSGSQDMRPKGDTGPSSLAFHGINTKMHGAMDIAFTGNADVDFVKGMIPHHQGAIDMAKTVLALGKDPAVRKLADEIIKAQESEIALMKEWLSKNGQ